MSIASECNRIIGLRDRIRNKLITLGLLTASQRTGDNDLEDCTDAIEGISGTQNITTTLQYDVAGKQYAQVVDSQLVSGNIVRGATILGVAGSAAVNPPAANLEVGAYAYGGAAAPPAAIYPSSGHDGFSIFELELTDVSPKLLPYNIKNGVTIMGVTGTFDRHLGSHYYHEISHTSSVVTFNLGSISSITSKPMVGYIVKGSGSFGTIGISAMIIESISSSAIRFTLLYGLTYVYGSWLGFNVDCAYSITRVESQGSTHYELAITLPSGQSGYAFSTVSGDSYDMYLNILEDGAAS